MQEKSMVTQVLYLNNERNGVVVFETLKSFLQNFCVDERLLRALIWIKFWIDICKWSDCPAICNWSELFVCTWGFIQWFFQKWIELTIELTFKDGKHK
jgi:hypothetical protein